MSYRASELKKIRRATASPTVASSDVSPSLPSLNPVNLPSPDDISANGHSSLQLVRSDERAPFKDTERPIERAFRDSERTGSPRARLAGRRFIPTPDLLEFLEEWMSDCIYFGQSKATLRGKRDAVEKLLWWLDREGIEQCGAGEVKRFLSYVANAHEEQWGRWDEKLACRDRAANRDPNKPPLRPDPRAFRPVSDRALQVYFVCIKSYFAFLASEEIAAIPSSPLEFTRQPSAKKARVQPFSIEEVADMLQIAGAGDYPRRDAGLIYFLLDTGVRVGEVANLRMEQVDIARGVAVVTGKGKKTREVCFGRDTRRALVAYLKHSPCAEDEKLFRSERGNTPGEGLTVSGLGRLIRKTGKAAAIVGKRCSPHTFRHTFASEFIKAGGAAKALQMLLGHEDIQMTMRYVTLAEADVKTQHSAASPTRLLRGIRRERD